MADRPPGILAFSLRVFAIALIFVVGWMAFVPAPDQIPFPHPEARPPARADTRLFWEALHGGHTIAVTGMDCGTRHGLPAGTPAPAPSATAPVPDDPDIARFHGLLCRLEADFEQQPDDPQLPGILAAAYNWRAQLGVHPAQTVRDLHEGRHHAWQAVDNGNRYAAGFRASPTWLLGFVTEDADLKSQGYDWLKTDTIEWAAFHGYIEGALLSAMLDPRRDDLEYDYDWALVSYMQNLEGCLWGESFLRRIHLPQGMRVDPFVMNLVSRLSVLRGAGWCYNNPAAPFNVPGLYLSQGDAYLKAGQMEYARIAYENAVASPNAANWPLLPRVQARLADMEAAREKFLADSGRFPVEQEPVAMMPQADWFCSTCHGYGYQQEIWP